MNKKRQTQEDRLDYQRKIMREYSKTHTAVFIAKELNEKLKDYAKSHHVTKKTAATQFIQYGLDNLTIRQSTTVRENIMTTQTIVEK